mmetsp:Transcript_2078/g.4512  ORF Transcript_2078/g.4512 Transcript_2078/m.4512 type:complete len:92 (-) Transcript_2078:37-312(-)
MEIRIMDLKGLFSGRPKRRSALFHLIRPQPLLYKSSEMRTTEMREPDGIERMANAFSNCRAEMGTKCVRATAKCEKLSSTVARAVVPPSLG